MNFAICQVSIAPLRADSSDRSEMVSQLLFGEKVQIIERKKNWIKVKADFDGYEGWADEKQFLEVSEEFYDHANATMYAKENFNLILAQNLPMILPMGAHLINLKDGEIQCGNHLWEYGGDYTNGDLQKTEIPNLAMQYLNTPYLWGGKSLYGIDCSGLVQQLYKFCGVQLPRDAYQQAEIGEVLSFLEEAEAGDLAFFDNPEGRIIHVGILLESNKIIHAHGKVRIDPIDTTGIFNTDSQTYSHKLRVIKRIL